MYATLKEIARDLKQRPKQTIAICIIAIVFFVLGIWIQTFLGSKNCTPTKNYVFDASYRAKIDQDLENIITHLRELNKQIGPAIAKRDSDELTRLKHEILEAFHDYSRLKEKLNQK